MADLAKQQFFIMKNESIPSDGVGTLLGNNCYPNDRGGTLTGNPAPCIVSENDNDKLVSGAIPASVHSNEILLYVDNENEGVQDLIRVALNQSMSTEELQQRLQAAGTNISMQGLGDDPTIISGDAPAIISIDRDGRSGAIPDENKTLLHNVDYVTDEKDCDNTNTLFHLASLSDNITSDRSQNHTGFIEGELDISDIKSESLDEVSVTDTDGTVNAIEDFIIANVNVGDSAIIPGEFAVGNAFYSLDEVEDALRFYEETHSVKLYKRDVRSLEALMKRSLKLQRLDKINESLKYGQLLYCCIYGGKRKAQKMACVDENGIARYTDCKMFVRFAISDDGMKLVVNGKLESHNHEEVVCGEPSTGPLYITNTGNADEIHLGAGFVDLEELYKTIHKYETDNHVHLWRRDGRTVEALAKRAPGTARKIMETNPGLRFAELRFCCSHGGRQLSEDKKEKMRVSNTFKQGCEMHIRFGVSDDGSQLVVKSMSEDHNHEINEDTIVKEALHPELCSYVSKLVWSDVNIGIEDVRKRLESYVCDEMFKDQTAPPRTRRQYFPSKKQIRYFMAKAKASLNITQEAEMKLEAQAEKLKETRGDEKMIFNFKAQTYIPTELVTMKINNEKNMLNANGEFFPPANTHDTKPLETQLINEAKILFCHQTPHQQRIMKRYSAQLIITQISDLHSKIPFPLFCLYVPTNVDFQIVGEFILQTNTAAMIMEGLQTFKEWNPGWSPKFVVCDFSEEQITAVESMFPSTFVLISDAAREKAWLDWLSIDENEVFQFKDEITKYLQAIANSYSEDALNNAARELEESAVWRMSDKLRNWFQLHWLSQAKRWVAGYRPDDYLMCTHHGRTLGTEVKLFKSIKLTNKSAPLQDIIQQIVEHVAPIACKQYEILNQESTKLQNQLKYLYPDIPSYLDARPGKVTYHVYERAKLALKRTYTLSYLHPGIFSVQGTSVDDDLLHTISFGDLNSFPSCDCPDWQLFKLPCVHLCAVFNNYVGWTWDMLSVAYKSSPVLNLDLSFIQEHSENEVGRMIDKDTQTSQVTFLIASNSPQTTNAGNFVDSQRLMETPQVLASQCRGLLQQLTKHQLTHHTRDNLYHLKTQLKELITMLSISPKEKTVMQPVAITDMLLLQNRGPGRPRKIVPAVTKPEVVQSVFEQYNVSPVTPVAKLNNAGERKIYPSRNRKPSTLVISRPPGVPSVVQQRDNRILTAVYVVDPTKVLVNTKDKHSAQNAITCSQLKLISQNQLETLTKVKSSTSSPRKRIQSPSVFLKPPPDKRIKEDLDSAEVSFNENVSLGNTNYAINGVINDDSLHDDSLLTVDEDSNMSLVIDSQSHTNIQLDQLPVTICGFTDSINTIDSIQTGTTNIVASTSSGVAETPPFSSCSLPQTPLSSGSLSETPSSSCSAPECSSVDSMELSSTSNVVVVAGSLHSMGVDMVGEKRALSCDNDLHVEPGANEDT